MSDLPSVERRATYYDESGERMPAWKAEISTGDVVVYGDHLVANFRDDCGGELNLEVRGGRLYLYSFDDVEGAERVAEVSFSLEESRALLRAASHMLVANTMAAVGVLKAQPEMRTDTDG